MRLIDADALLKHECEADRMGAMLVVGKGYILSAPTVRATETARWKGRGFGDFACSLCDESRSGKSNYCPNCGAKMDLS